jgi:membrane-associated phospholipid phosphatase
MPIAVGPSGSESQKVRGSYAIWLPSSPILVIPGSGELDWALFGWWGMQTSDHGQLLVRRQRPQGEWGSIYRNTDPHSFPSGHAARATLLTILIFVLGPSWLILPMAIWAPLVALARVSMGLHYISDIIAGGILGSLSAVIWLAVLN